MNTDVSCRRCRDALVELTAGTLRTADEQVTLRHLATCPDCRRERDRWLALGDAIRERGRNLPADGGYTSGLLRLRAAIELENQDHFEDPEGEESPMARDPQQSDWRAHTTSYGADRRATVDGSRRRSYPAFAAAAAVVLLSALVFGAMAAGLHSGAGGSSPTVTPMLAATATATLAGNIPLQTVPALPGVASVVSLSMVSATDGWAVASTPGGDALLLHYASGRWTPSGGSYAGVYLTDISMDAPDDGWAVGFESNQVTGVVLHYSGGHWSQVQTPHIEFAGSRVWAFSPSQVLVLASLPQVPSNSPPAQPSLAEISGFGESALLRYDNGKWTETLSPAEISDMTVLPGGDIWAACLDGKILHYQDGRWTSYAIAGQASGQEGQPLSISMLSGSDGWVAGFTNSVPQGMFLAHFDGRTWIRVPGPAASGPTDIYTVALVSPSEGWAGGELYPSGPAVLLHDVDGQWQPVPAPYSGSISKIVMVSAAEGWATVNDGGAAGLLHYQNGLWTPYRGGAES